MALQLLAYLKHAPSCGRLYSWYGHLRVETCFDSNYVGDCGGQKSTSSFCTYNGVNLVTQQSHKKQVVLLLSIEAEYRAMIQASFEMLWVRSLLTEPSFLVLALMSMFCDNQAYIFIMNNPTFHEHTKHIEIDYHIISYRIYSGLIFAPQIVS